MIFVALLFVVPFVVAQQDPSFVPSNQQPPPQVGVPSGSSQVGGQINIQPGSGALPAFDPNNPQANQQPPVNSGAASQGQIPPSSFSNQEGSQLNPAQPAQPAQQPFDPNNPQQQPNQQGGVAFDNQQQQPNQQGGVAFNNQQSPQNPQPSSGEQGEQPSSAEHVVPTSGSQGGSSTEELFGTQPPSHESSLSTNPTQPSDQNQLQQGQEQTPNQVTGGFTGQPANSSVNAIMSGLVLLFAALIGLL